MKETDIRTLIAWAIGLILALFFILNGWPKIAADNSAIVERFKSWGYTSNFALTIGILEIIGGIMVLVPRVAFYGALLLSAIMVGAIYTHLSTGIGSPIFAIFLLILAVAQVVITRKRAWLLSREV